MTAQPYHISSDLDQASWDSFVTSCSEASAYHRYAWRGVIERSFGHQSHYLAALDQAGKAQGVLPLFHVKSALFGNFLISVPFVNYGGLLCRSELAERELLVEAERLRRRLGARYVELRHFGRPVAGLPTSSRKVTMLLPLAGSEDEQWERLDPKVRNQIRKALKSGLSFRMGGAELLDDFYRVFAHNMRDLGTPVYSKSFFREVTAALDEGARVLTVDLGELTVAAGIATASGEVVEMPWASSLAEHRPLCPNNLLYWEAIRFAIRRGGATFDFGRSTVGEGTYRFKKQWGAQPVQLYWQYLMNEGEPLPELSPSNPKYRLAIRLWQRLPVALTKVLGPPIVRKIP
ncbi:FemAB family XrtA/PEP-CTERM system-associated protein [Geomonas sp.]|uniref:FemAB family XrtA/PEP-CTERM system-associated protein n=1 Tax=Geomonas sp. TaxID=2651584 RepID=UPI002B461A9D|nr:FemAB family XrtA/PEP-CTERM system-associated protein [Geomonas sp.]HJV33623.1 FemAB family XrtA/PEP-CTERM system-associated protein [Geomonas sp.]